MLVKLLAFVLPLSLDEFAMAAALAAARPLTARDRLRVAVVFTAFEGGMPLIGLALGAGLARSIGGFTDYLAGAAVIAIGVWMLFGEDEQSEQAKAGRLTRAHGMAVIGIGLTLSLDELAIGFGLGLADLPFIPVVLAIAIQTFLGTQLGLALGNRLSEHLRERTRQFAAIALIVLGAALLTGKLLADPTSNTAALPVTTAMKIRL
ncbi:MAG TPA: manganese efflux pump [Actinomadura sp.]|jgi:putative Mn2+ efflux pump MntP|nr:manganese efflux pump [Actinomadura sp.]